MPDSMAVMSFHIEIGLRLVSVRSPLGPELIAEEESKSKSMMVFALKQLTRKAGETLIKENKMREVKKYVSSGLDLRAFDRAC